MRYGDLKLFIMIAYTYKHIHILGVPYSKIDLCYCHLIFRESYSDIRIRVGNISKLYVVPKAIVYSVLLQVKFNKCRCF